MALTHTTLFIPPCLFISIGFRFFWSLVICDWADDRLVGASGLGATFAHTVFCRCRHMWNFYSTCDEKANHICNSNVDICHACVKKASHNWKCPVHMQNITIFPHVEPCSVFHLRKKKGKHMTECSSHVKIVDLDLRKRPVHI